MKQHCVAIVFALFAWLALTVINPPAVVYYPACFVIGWFSDDVAKWLLHKIGGDTEWQ